MESSREYVCSIPSCGKSFAKSSNLIQHLRIHTGEKPYCCKLCGQCFRQSGNLTKHLRAHQTAHLRWNRESNEKPFKCGYPGCGRSFTAKGSLQKHSHVHLQEESPQLLDQTNSSSSNITWSQSSVCKDRAVGANTKGPTIDADMQLYMFEEYRRLKSIFAKVAQLSTSSCSSSSPSEERQAQESYEECHTHNLPRHHKRPRLAHDRPDHGDAQERDETAALLYTRTSPARDCSYTGLSPITSNRALPVARSTAVSDQSDTTTSKLLAPQCAPPQPMLADQDDLEFLDIIEAYFEILFEDGVSSFPYRASDPAMNTSSVSVFPSASSENNENITMQPSDFDDGIDGEKHSRIFQQLSD